MSILTMSEVSNLLVGQANIMVNKNLARTIGLQEAVMYCELLSKSKYFTEKEQLTNDDYFYNTAEDLLDSTGLSRYQQTSCINTLVKLGLIETKIMGIPSKKYFKICNCADKIVELLHEGNLKHTEFQLSRNLKPRVKETSNLALQKLETNNTNIININNNTKEDYAIPVEIENISSFSQETIDFVHMYTNYYYPERFGFNHPHLRHHQYYAVLENVEDFVSEKSIDLEHLAELADAFFDDPAFANTNHSIVLFSQPNIMEIRYQRNK